MMRRLLILAILMAMCVNMAFAAGRAQPADDSPIAIDLVWDSMDERTKQAWYDYLIYPFQEKHPNVIVRLQPIPEALTVVRVQIQSGAGPDFFTADAFDLKNYVDSNLIIPLDKYVDSYGWDKIIVPWALQAAQVHGKQYGVPRGIQSSHLMYNQELLDAHGWSVPKSRAEFVALNEAIMNAGLIPIAYGSAGAPLVQQWLYNHYLNTTIHAAGAKALFTGQAKFTDARVREAFQLLYSDWQAGWFNNRNSAAISVGDARGLWYRQQAVFLTEGSWISRALTGDVVNFKFGATQWPSMRDGTPAASGLGHAKAIAVSIHSKQADEVALFLDFMYNNVELGARAAGRGVEPIPVEIPVSAYPTDGHPDVMVMFDATMQVIRDPQLLGGYHPWTTFPTRTNHHLYDNLDNLFYGRMSLDEYLSRAQQLLDEELAAGWQYAIR